MALNDGRILLRALVAGTLVATLALGACGRKGDLEPPPGANVSTNDAATDNPVEAESARKPDRPFILDGLL